MLYVLIANSYTTELTVNTSCNSVQGICNDMIVNTYLKGFAVISYVFSCRTVLVPLQVISGVKLRFRPSNYPAKENVFELSCCRNKPDFGLKVHQNGNFEWC